MTEYVANPTLTGISLAYVNPKYIADKIFNKVPVFTRQFEYKRFNKSLNLQLPETFVGDKGLPEIVDFKGEKLTASLEGHSLLDEIAQTDIDDADGDRENLEVISTEFLTNVFLGAREKRIADLLQNSANYNGNVKNLTNDEKFTSSSVDAFGIIDDAMDDVWMKPNIMVGSRKAINALRRNPSVVSAAYKNSGTSGKATVQNLKDMFELDEVYIGESVANTAKRGQEANFVGTWGNTIMLLYINPNAKLKRDLTFGLTVERGHKEISQFYEPKRGVRGVLSNKISEEIKDLIIAPDCGYLITNIY